MFCSVDYNTHWDMSSERLHDLYGLEELMDRRGKHHFNSYVQA